jgi:hypothetical protein
MRKMIFAIALVAGLFAFSGAMAHDETDEPHRNCGDTPAVQGDDYAGLCLQDVGLIQAGSNGEGGGYITADGAAEMGSADDSPDQWLDGYVLVTADDNEGVHVYCAGNGSFENGAQADDELVLLNADGDCLSPPA